MFHRVYSPLLAPEKVWYALNQDVTGDVPPRRFCQSNIFELFPEEVCCLNYVEDDLRDRNGAQISRRCFSSRQKATDPVFVGTTFAVIVGSLRKQNLGNVGFLKSSRFAKIRGLVNREELSDAAADHEPCTTENRDSSTADVEGLLASYVSEIAELKSRLERLENQWDESPPTESPPKSWTSSPNSSISDIEQDPSYAPSTKKKKIQNNFAQAMAEIDGIFATKGDRLQDIIAHGILLHRGSTEFEELVGDIFSTVEEKYGVVKALKKLVPPELWAKRVNEMAVPDWMLLLCKLEIPISDDGWQTLLNRTNLGKSGVRCTFSFCRSIKFLYSILCSSLVSLCMQPNLLQIRLWKLSPIIIALHSVKNVATIFE